MRKRSRFLGLWCVVLASSINLTACGNLPFNPFGGDGEGGGIGDIIGDIIGMLGGGLDIPGLPFAELPLCQEVEPGTPPDELGLDSFYQKHINASGIAIVSSENVPDEAFQVANHVVSYMLAGHPHVRDALLNNGVRVGIIAESEVTTDMPEYADLNSAFPEVDWDERARGLGATHARPLVSVAEENLLQYADDRYFGESILVHEFAHTFFQMGVAELEDGQMWTSKLEEIYDNAMDQGLWADSYASTDMHEYWAEGVQSWFNINLENQDGVHNHVNTRAELREYDPSLASFIEMFFGETSWSAFCVPTQG